MSILLKLFLNPRVLIALALVALLAFSHFTAYRKGKNDVRLEWQASVSAANEEARRLERARQSAADAAARRRAEREASIVADSNRARAAVDSLRDAIGHANRVREESAASAAKRAAAIGELLETCSREYQELGRKADRHVNDLRQYQEAWPQ